MTNTVETRFFTFGQNNSGGGFDLTDDVTHYVIVEAENAHAANAKLESIGGYFNGCEADIDCYCCGDRWYAKGDEEAGEPVPLIWGQTPAEYVADRSFLWMPEGKEVVVHYADGRKEWF
jgi:hypothetical protein